MSRGDDSMNLKGFKGQTDLSENSGLACSEFKLQLLNSRRPSQVLWSDHRRLFVGVE